MGANMGNLSAGNVIKTRAQSGKNPSADSLDMRGGLSQSKIIRGTNQPSKGMGHDNFSRSYGLRMGKPAKTKV